MDLGRQAELFQALSTEIRIAVVLVLSDGEVSVGDLVDELHRRWPGKLWERTNISKHLMVLRSVGVVSFKGDAQRRIYKLEMPCLVQAIRCSDEVCGGGSCAS